MNAFFLCIRRIRFLGHPSAWPVNMQYSIQKTMSGDSSRIILEVPSAQYLDSQVSEKRYHLRDESGVRIRRHLFLLCMDSWIQNKFL